MRTTLGAALVLAAALAQKDKPPTIAEAMRKLNGGANSMTRNLGLDLKDKDPDWEDIQETTKEYAQLVATLEKGTPPRGDKASWKRRAAAYAANARALDAAARRKDRTAASAALARITQSCNACHEVHRPKE